MRKKRKFLFLSIAFLFIILLFYSCQKKEYKYSDVAYFAEPIIQDFCAGFTNNDYNEFAKYFINYMSIPIKVEDLERLFSKIGDTIGSYIPDSISYKSVKRVNNIFIINYVAKFTDENEPVNITLNFEKKFNEFKVAGFNVDSPKLRKNK